MSYMRQSSGSKQRKKRRQDRTRISTNKKFEGYSQLSNQSKRKTQAHTSKNFQEHLKDLQLQAEQNIEDEYINSLQEEIKFLELELKLLKDKEYEQQQGLNEVDKYFTDGCSVNENILGIKTRYEKQDKAFQNQIQKTKDAILDEEESKAELENQIDLHNTKAVDLDKEFHNSEKEINARIDKFQEGMVREQHIRELFEKELEEKTQALKGKVRQNTAMRRTIEQNEITKEKRWDDQKKHKKKKLDKKTELLLAIELYNRQLDDLEHLADFRVQQQKWEESNDSLQKDVNKIEAECMSLQSEVNEYKTTLGIQKRNREKENKKKAQLIDDIANITEKIDQFTRLSGNETALLEEVKDIELDEIEKMIEKTRQTDQKILDRKGQIDDLDANIDRLSEDKVEGAQKQFDLQEKYRELVRELEENRTKYLDSKVKLDYLSYRLKKLNEVSYENETKKMAIDIENYKFDIGELKQRCQKYETLRELAEELKKFNVEEMLIIRKTNEQITQKVRQFGKSWQKINENYDSKKQEFLRQQQREEMQAQREAQQAEREADM